MTDHNEAMSQLPHKLATLIKCLPQAPFRDHLTAECIKQAERIAELERLSTGLSAVYNEAMESLRIAVDERDTLRADADRYRWLRAAHWSSAPLCCVLDPKANVRLGATCPSGDQLDAAIEQLRGK